MAPPKIANAIRVIATNVEATDMALVGACKGCLLGKATEKPHSLAESDLKLEGMLERYGVHCAVLGAKDYPNRFPYIIALSKIQTLRRKPSLPSIRRKV